MRLEVQFKHMERSEALENFVQEKITPTIEEVLNREDCHIMVWLMNEHSRALKGVPEYKCEIEIRFPPRRDLFVSKSSHDMHVAISDAIDALHGQLREESKREIQRRQK